MKNLISSKAAIDCLLWHSSCRTCCRWHGLLTCKHVFARLARFTEQSKLRDRNLRAPKTIAVRSIALRSTRRMAEQTAYHRQKGCHSRGMTEGSPGMIMRGRISLSMHEEASPHPSKGTKYLWRWKKDRLHRTHLSASMIPTCNAVSFSLRACLRNWTCYCPVSALLAKDFDINSHSLGISLKNIRHMHCHHQSA